ncbi:beta family protein [Psychrobacter namhaensis]|uniref:beta family protein n=1 Tax=Psychrobacter namhaensis TaxID=292734 RepID=UPI0018DFAA59|nr:beta family protein [Psychrobacter namhaensis]
MNDKPLLYTPLLNSKRGEYNALCDLSNNVKQYVKPIIILTKEKTIARGEILAKTIKSKWGNNPIYIDLDQADNVSIQGMNYVDFILNALDINSVDYSPVINVLHPNQRIIRHIVQNGLSSCIRIDISTFDSSTVVKLQNLLSELLEGNAYIDLLLDFKSDIKSSPSAHAHYISTYYNAISSKFGSQIHRFIIAGSSTPEEFVRADYNPYGLKQRVHWLGFCDFLTSISIDTKAIVFADYSITYPGEGEPITYVNPNAKIRYTLANDYMYAIGHPVHTHVDGFGQFHDISQIIVNTPHFLGSNYSWGDRYLYDCAQKLVKCGNMETWVRVGHNHHITYATKQNASRHGISI